MADMCNIIEESVRKQNINTINIAFTVAGLTFGALVEFTWCDDQYPYDDDMQVTSSTLYTTMRDIVCDEVSTVFSFSKGKV